MQHIENLKTHEELYKSEFQKDEIVKYSNEFNEIAFSDELGLFAVQNKNLGQKFHEMFRYDQIRNYFIWVDKDAQDPVKLSRVEVILQLQDHPYCSKIRIMCAIKQSEYQKVKESTAEPVIKKLDEIFGKPHEEVVDKVRTNLSVNINGFSISTDRVSELTNFMKNGFGQGEGDRENEQYVRANKAQYTERSNEAEKKYKITK